MAGNGIRLLGITPSELIHAHLSAQAIRRQERLDPEHLESLVSAFHAAELREAAVLQLRRDAYVGAVRVEDQHAAQEQIAIIVSRTHEWGTIGPQAVAIQLAREAQRFAEPEQVTAALTERLKAPTPPPPPQPLPTLAEILRKEPQPPAGFDPFALTTEDLEGLPTLGAKLQTQVNIYRAFELFALTVIDGMKSLEKNDFASLAQVIRRVQEWQWNILSLLQKPLPQVGESAAELIYLLTTPLELLKDKGTPWENALANLRRNFNLTAVPIDGTHGYYTYPARKKYAAAMAHWLSKYATSKTWEDGKWKLVGNWQMQLNDPRLQAYLDLLGWQLEVQYEGARTIVTVDFGRWGN